LGIIVVVGISEKSKSYLGLARRAGKLAIGQDKTLQAIRVRESALVILSEDCGTAAERKIRGKAKTASVKVLTLGTRTELGQAIGLAPVSALAVLDRGFAAIIEKYENSNRVLVED